MKWSWKRKGWHWILLTTGMALPAFGADLPAAKPTPMLDPVVVSASKLSSPLSQVGSSVTVISGQDLAEQGVKNVGQALSLVPGVDVVVSGGPGQLTETYIRGSESGRTLVMLNGVEINDAISPGRSADFSNLSIDNVERIEVLRGPESAVYGSGAMGGVVNIITQQGSKTWRGGADLSGGKYSTWDASAGASGSSDGVDVSLGASWGYSSGFSAAKRMLVYPEPVPDMEPNGYRIWTVDAGLGYALSRDWTTRLSYRLGREVSHLDYFSGDAGDTPNFIEDTVQQFLHWDLAGKSTPWWQQTLSAGLAQADRDYQDTPLPGTVNASNYHGRNVSLEWKHQLDWAEWNSAGCGVNYRQEQGRSQDPQYGDYFDEQSSHLFGVYVEERIKQWGAILDASTRWDVYDRYGTRFTYRLAPVYTWLETNTSVKGSWGTGFNTPSLYQLYSSYGNVNLQPETSQGWDAGLEQKIGGDYKAGITYFENDFSSQIDYDFTSSRYANKGKVQTKGWEMFGVAVPMPDLTLRLGYTKLTANDLTNQDTLGPVPLERRADYKLTLDAGYQWQAVGLHVSAQRVGPRWGKDSELQRIVLAPYTLVNLRCSYAVSPELEIYAKIDNLFDADYMEVFGYSTPRFSALGGLKYAWK